MRDEETNAIIGIHPPAFALRPQERNLSVCWLEVFPGTREQKMRGIIDHSELEVRPSHAYAVFVVGDFMKICADEGEKVRIIHEPTTDPSHTAVHRYPRENHDLMAALANRAANDLTIVKDVP
jgi:hypothetical protein